jgi:hypothetical protein
MPHSERPATLPESMVATLSQWQNLKHTMEDPSIATAEYEGRKIGMQLFHQAQEMEAFSVLREIVKWLKKIIADTYHNFTMPSKIDREESGNVYSWSHTQRLDYNFFTGIRSEIVGMVQDSKRARQPVPENCRGGFEHLVVSSDVQRTVPAPAPVPTPAAPQAQRLVDDQERTIPPVLGGLGIQQPCNQNTTAIGEATSVLEGRQREEYRQSLTYVPHDQRRTTTTGLATPQTGDRLILGRLGEAPAVRGIEINSSSQPDKNNVPGGIQVQDQRRLTPGVHAGSISDTVPGALNYPVKSTDWVKALNYAVELDKANTPYRSSPYSTQHGPEYCPFARPPPEQHKERSSTHGVDNKWMEEFVDFGGAAPPAGDEVRNANKKNTSASPERVLFSVRDLPDIPTSDSAPTRRGSDSSVPTEMGDGIFSDAGSATVSPAPEGDMDEVDMLSTDHMEVIRSSTL